MCVPTPFYSDAALCPPWHKRIMRREEGRHQRDEDEGRQEGENDLHHGADLIKMV